MRALALLFCLSSTAAAQTAIVGDAWFTGALSVGTTSQSGRIFVQASSMTEVPFQVSGVDETPFIQLSKTGKLGLGMTPTTRLEVNGAGEASDIAVQLRNGNLFPSTALNQITFGYNGTTNLRHAIRTEHSIATSSSSIDFLLWTPAVSTTAIGTLRELSLQTTSFAGSVHVLPTSELAHADLEISDGTTTGGGSMLSAQELTPSSRALKTDISPLSAEESAQAYSDVAGLRHAIFRYKTKSAKRKGKTPLTLGLIFEDAPKSIQGPAETLVLDERVINAELALKELIDRLEAAETRAQGLAR